MKKWELYLYETILGAYQMHNEVYQISPPPQLAIFIGKMMINQFIAYFHTEIAWG